jgi:hypothetical protein
MSAAGIDNLSTDLVSPELTCVSDRNIPENSRSRAASPVELDGIGGDQCPMYPNSPHTMINGGEPSNHYSCESKPTTGESLSRAASSAEATGEPPKTNEDVTPREHDQSGSDVAAKAPARIST